MAVAIEIISAERVFGVVISSGGGSGE